MNNSINFTNGSLNSKIIRFVIPLVATSIIQQLYNTVDLIYAGQLLGKEASAAIGAGTMLVTCLVGFFTGAAVGASVVISRYFGARKPAEVVRGIDASLYLGIITGITVGLLGYLMSPFFIRGIDVPKELWDMSVSYLRIYFASSMSITLYNYGAAVLRSVGNSTTQVTSQVIGGLSNVIADGIFIGYFDMGVEGVAVATLFSQTIATVIILFSVFRLRRSLCSEKQRDADHILQNKELRRDMWEMTRIGVSAGLQTLAIAFSNVMAQYQINGLGIDTIAAFTAYYKVELLIYYPITAFGSAATIVVSQNMGAGQYANVRKSTMTCLKMCISVTVISSLLCLIFSRALFSVFSTDYSVIDAGMRICMITFPMYFLYSVLQIYGDALRGIGQSFAPMAIILVNICIVRTVFLFALNAVFHSAAVVAVSYPVSWATCALCMYIAYKKHSKKNSLLKLSGLKNSQNAVIIKDMYFDERNRKR